MLRKRNYKIITLRQQNKIDIHILKFIHKKNCFEISFNKHIYIFFTYGRFSSKARYLIRIIIIN